VPKPTNLLREPPPENVAAGEYPLGIIHYGEDKFHPFGLREAEFIQHIAIFGRSGSGKTNVAYLILLNLVRAGKPFLVFDWKRNYRDLLSLPECKGLLVFTVGRNVSPFRFKPALGNTYATFAMSLKHRGDIAMIKDCLLLDSEQAGYLGKLDVGWAVTKLQGRWFKPFLVSFPIVTLDKGSMTDEAIRARLAALPEGRSSLLAAQEGNSVAISGQEGYSISSGAADAAILPIPPTEKVEEGKGREGKRGMHNWSDNEGGGIPETRLTRRNSHNYPTIPSTRPLFSSW